MTEPPTAEWALFEVAPLWCLDTNVVLAFFKEDDDEPYSRSVLPDQWGAFEVDMASGLIVAPPQVKAELTNWIERLPELRPWLHTHRGMFHDLDDDALAAVKDIVNKYPVYAKNLNYLGDLCVIGLAMARTLAVISNELPTNGPPSPRRPKIPDVCREFSVECVTTIGFLRRRSQGG